MYLKITWIETNEPEVLTFKSRKAAEKFVEGNEGKYVPGSIQYSYDPLTEGMTVRDLIEALQKIETLHSERPIYIGYYGGTPVKKIERIGDVFHLY